MPELTQDKAELSPVSGAEAHSEEEHMSDDLQERRMLRRAYRVAKKEGFRLTKSRRAISEHNRGGLMLVDPSTNVAVLGWDYDALPEEILDYFDVLEPPLGESKDEGAAGDSHGGER
jgi:hypothetical protein